MKGIKELNEDIDSLDEYLKDAKTQNSYLYAIGRLLVIIARCQVEKLID
jgi:hypothetical protein